MKSLRAGRRKGRMRVPYACAPPLNLNPRRVFEWNFIASRPILHNCTLLLANSHSRTDLSELFETIYDTLEAARIIREKIDYRYEECDDSMEARERQLYKL